MNRERWRQRAQRASDAFGLVLALVLLTYVLASVLSAAFPGIVVYLILWIVMPSD